jgi:hypothetical protein
MFDSVHFARWLAQFQDEPINFLLFPSSPHRRLHKKLSDLLVGNSSAKYSLGRFTRFAGLPLWISDKVFDNKLRGSLVKRAVRRFKPQYVHALELQNAGYIALASLEENKPDGLQLIITNYGSDIFWFRKFPNHLAKIKRLLAISDQYACECTRDVQIALELGFKGEVKPVRPNAGGFSQQILETKLLPASERKMIAIKGYHGWVGRAHTAIEALKHIRDELCNYEIVFFSCNTSTIRLAKKCSIETGLKVITHGKGKLTHQQMLELFGKSAVYVGLSESDGISTSLLEAMAMGAIPIQTSTACCDEWFDAKSGVAVTSIDSDTVAKAILRALEMAEDGLAARVNHQTIVETASEDYVKQAALSFYR